MANPSAQNNFDGDAVTLQVATLNQSSQDSSTITASGLPSGLSLANTGIVSGTLPSNADGTYKVAVTATDATTGATTNESFRWTITRPTVTLKNFGNQGEFDGSTINLGIAAADSAGHALTFSASGLPAGLSIDSGSGAISGSISYDTANQGVHVVTFTATDVAANVTASQTVKWNVGPVAALAQGDQYNNDGDTVKVVTYFWEASTDAVTFSATGLPSGLSINSVSGTISGTIAYGANSSSPYSVTITATDSTANLTTSTSFSWNVSPLSVSFLELGALANLPGDTISNPSVDATTSDGSALAFTASGLPAGLTINSSTGTISGTIGAGAASTNPYQVTITATQASANISVTQSITWTVAVMLMANPGDQTNFPGDAVSLAASAIDGAGGTPTFTATGLPAGLSINASTGTISGTIASSATASSPYSVTVTATDGSASVSQSFHWNVSQVIVSDPGKQFNSDGDAIGFNIAASAVSGDAVSYSATGLPEGITINSSTGAISGILASNADANGPYSVTVTATDTITNAAATDTFAWAVYQQGDDQQFVDELNFVQQPQRQGQLPLKRYTRNNFHQELVAPTARAAFHGDAVLAGMLL